MLTNLDLSERRPLLDGRRFGSAGSYEQCYGSARFTLDPTDPLNTRIADLRHAPLNAEGRVECRADIWILHPTDTALGNGALMYHVVNRGRNGVLSTYNLAEGTNRPETAAHFGDGFLLNQGYTIAACAWQADVPPSTPEDDNLLTFDVPVATQNGETITGPVGCEILVDVPCDLHTLGSRFHIPYEVAEGTEQTATLTVREKPYDPHHSLNRSTWTFDRMPDGRPAIRYPDGFVPGKLYNLVYTGRDPRIVGLGFASTRDFVSCLKYETDRFDCLKDKVRVDRAHAFGSSQSGRFLRHLLYEGFNEDEQNRKVFDGIIANVAGGGMGSFNHRFAQPSRHASAHFDVYYPTEQFPFTDRPQTDPVTGTTAGLLDRSEASDTVPRIFYTNTSTEYWNRSASLTHTDLSGEHDLDVHPSVRIYHFAGTQHGPADLPTGADQLPGNPVNFRLGHRALLVALDRWVGDGIKPPIGSHGKISDGTLVEHSQIKDVWPEAVQSLPEIPRTPRRLNHGQSWKDGIITNEPPDIGEPYRLLLPAIDADGNEVAGIRLPEVTVPLGTFAGWRLRTEEQGARWAIVGLQGFWLPFPAQATSTDPRAAIAARYSDRDDYISRCRVAAEALVTEGYLLAADIERVTKRAARLYDWAISRT
jgi:hypothetical protein